MGEPVAPEQFGELLQTYARSAFRLELQRAYSEPTEAATVARFLAGDAQDPTEVPMLADWYAQVRDIVASGRTMERVRVHEDPPTDYQRWERWIGRWNIAAGETIRYMTRDDAYRVGLLPSAGDRDWWLLDERQLIVMTFDADGRRLITELETDPAMVAQACAWRDLAVHHTTPDDSGGPPS